MRYRHALTEEPWNKIDEHLPGKTGDPKRTAADHRLFVNAVLYVLKTGILWADLPAGLGKPNPVWKRYDRWVGTGVWERVGRALGDADLTEPPEDSNSTRPASRPTPRPRRADESRVKKQNAEPRRCFAHPTAPGIGLPSSGTRRSIRTAGFFGGSSRRANAATPRRPRRGSTASVPGT
ncbi:MAG: transposase [Planctomycetota bacterium]